MNAVAFSGSASLGVVVTFEHIEGTLRLRGTITRQSDSTRLVMQGTPRETREALGRRLRAAMERYPTMLSFQYSHLYVGAKVEMTMQWRELVGIDKGEIYRSDDMGIFPKDFHGVVEKFEKTKRGVFAVVRHAHENCGCNFASGTDSGSSYQCRRCEGLGTAFRRFIRVDYLQPCATQKYRD